MDSEQLAPNKPRLTLYVFDPNITENSPAGSCLLKMLRMAASTYQLRIFTSKTDLTASDHIIIHKIPAPARPVFLQNIVFTLLASLSYLLHRGDKGLQISTQGAFPFCDIAYAHNPHKLFLKRYRRYITGGFFARAARILNYLWIAAMESIAFRHARLVVVPSQGLATELAESYGAAIESKLRVIPNPVDCAAYQNPHASHVPRSFTFAFCALGNFEWKGLGLVIRALAPGAPVLLKVIGGNQDEIRHFRQLAQTLGVAHQVSFLGPSRDIRPHLWTSDVFVFPSLHESFGLVCLQAAAAGLPLITTDLYALNQLVLPEISGWKVERTVESVRAAMQAAASNPEHTDRMGRNAQQLAQNYDLARFLENWDELLRSTVP